VTLDEIKRLIELVQTSAIAEIEYAHGEERIRIVREREAQSLPSVFTHTMSAPPPAAPAPVAISAPAPEAPAAAPQPVASNLLDVKSPMVGTFYRAPAPDAPVYVEVGTRISKGQIVCIIEAMKLMNEIPSEVSGTVAEIVAENSQPVEFGQVLVRVTPD
jgi:acetyl-CoA carboxylase biotin carboxyl carrier protein